MYSEVVLHALGTLVVGNPDAVVVPVLDMVLVVEAAPNVAVEAGVDIGQEEDQSVVVVVPSIVEVDHQQEVVRSSLPLLLNCCYY